jgi:hypothetical protein
LYEPFETLRARYWFIHLRGTGCGWSCLIDASAFSNSVNVCMQREEVGRADMSVVRLYGAQRCRCCSTLSVDLRRANIAYKTSLRYERSLSMSPLSLTEKKTDRMMGSHVIIRFVVPQTAPQSAYPRAAPRPQLSSLMAFASYQG